MIYSSSLKMFSKIFKISTKFFQIFLLFRCMVQSVSTTFFFSNHRIKYVQQLFLVSPYSPLSYSYSWLNDPFSKPVPPVWCFRTFLLLSAFFFSPHLWQTPLLLVNSMYNQNVHAQDAADSPNVFVHPSRIITKFYIKLNPGTLI